jgi:hypothetical protein
MWPRDLLSRALHKRKRYGRYMTFGYNAGTKDRDPHVIKTIDDAAEQLLVALRQAGFAVRLSAIHSVIETALVPFLSGFCPSLYICCIHS